MATLKQKIAFEKVVNGGSTLTGAMKEAGYALSTSKRTEKLTATQGWQELMDKHLPDSILTKRHRELLNKNEANGNPDTQAVSKALDMAYKIKKRYEDNGGGNKTLVLIVTGESAQRYGALSNRITESNSN